MVKVADDVLAAEKVINATSATVVVFGAMVIMVEPLPVPEALPTVAQV